MQVLLIVSDNSHVLPIDYDLNLKIVENLLKDLIHFLVFDKRVHLYNYQRYFKKSRQYLSEPYHPTGKELCAPAKRLS